MTRTFVRLLAVATALGVVACSGESGTGPTSSSAVSLAAAFSSVPAGFSNTDNTFPASADAGQPWMPDGREGHMEDHGGMRLGPGGGFGMGFGGMMGGGMHGLFLGGGFGLSFGHGPDGGEGLSSCSFNSGSGRIVCAPVTRNGLTITRSVAFTTASGQAQSAFDSLTNSINSKVTVSGTFTRRDSATTTVQESSDRTVSGLVRGSTQRKIDGTSAGTESTTGRDTAGTFTAVRTVGDTTRGVVIPLNTGTFPFPTAGTIIRAMNATLTRSGATPATVSRREVITYDGSNTAKLVITENGQTRNCTLPLPFGRPTCQ